VNHILPMILGKVRIQNFKSIKDTGWVYLSRTDPITILAGQNESGKTSFLRALRFFQEGVYDTFEEEDRRLGEPPRVDCTFYLNDKEIVEFAKVTNVRIADYIAKNGFNILRGSVDGDNFDLRYSVPDEQTKLLEEFNKSTTSPVVEGVDPPPIKEEFSIFKYMNALRPPMVFYSSFLNNNLPGKATKADLSSNQAIQDFESIYNVDFEHLMNSATPDKERRSEEERVREEAADSLNKYWKQVISGEKTKYRYNITVTAQPDISQSFVNFYINQGDHIQLSFSQKSHGFQWFAGFNLRLRAHESEMEDKGLILLIDEPGQGLHEVAQQDIKNVMEELARKAGMQVIYSTHQPILLGKEEVDFSRLLLVDRTTKKGSKFKTISALISSSGSMDALAPIRSALGMVTLTDPFAAKKTLVVEGITEYFFLKAIMGDEYVYVPSAGVDQVPNIFSILYAWGISPKALFDDDTQGRKAFGKLKKFLFNDEETEDLHKSILKPEGKEGIEEFLSETTISLILDQFGKKYIASKSKVENVEQIGKYIFAKSFYDKYHTDPSALDDETVENFLPIKEFLGVKKI
jgi:predicted ATP-dependent endonuclease of OLD family